MQTITTMKIDPQKSLIRYRDTEMLDEATMAMLNEYAQGNPEIVQDIIDSFEPEATILINDIKTALAKRDAEMLRIAIHSLAGISGSIGASRLKKISTDLENTIKSGNIEEAMNEAPVVFIVFDHLIAILKEM